MKLKIISLFLIFWIGKGTAISAQVVNFQDEAFLEYLLLYTTVDSSKDGQIQVSEAEAFTGVFTINSNITKLGGIEYFKNLTRLGIYSSPITTLDISQNTKLQYLEIKQSKLASVNIATNTDLTTVVLNNNSLLTQLTIGSKPQLQLLNIMYNKLVSVDVSLCPKLAAFYMTDNKLTTLDVSQNPRLAELNVGANLLTSLDLSNNSRLTYLAMGYNNIPSIDLSKNTILNMAFIQGNPITSIDLSKNTYLTQLVVDDTDITSIDISMLSMLQYFYANYTKLTTIDASNNKDLIYINAVECPVMRFINFKNDYNTNVYGFFAINSPNLKCIQVDNPTYSSSQQLWQKDSTAVYATDCSTILATGETNNKKVAVYPNPTKGMLYLSEKANDVSVYNTAGQLVAVFKDSASINLENLPVGNYVVKTFNSKDKTYTVTKVIRN
ncbi:T9SS type A sorting domain-containing protein [Epilithonimonas sp. UC225_85]|uniref:leucine-rich repeat domain-containing protein n=1 Tax=Epilithonimonas sp. UC225_85 TaxID=3350167 RepID=UPI0036D26D36